MLLLTLCSSSISCLPLISHLFSKLEKPRWLNPPLHRNHHIPLITLFSFVPPQLASYSWDGTAGIAQSIQKWGCTLYFILNVENIKNIIYNPQCIYSMPQFPLFSCHSMSLFFMLCPQPSSVLSIIPSPMLCQHHFFLLPLNFFWPQIQDSKLPDPYPWKSGGFMVPLPVSKLCALPRLTCCIISIAAFF